MDMSLTLDINSDIFPLAPQDRITICLASSLHASGPADMEDDEEGAGSSKREAWRGGDEGLASEFDYVVYGKVRSLLPLSTSLFVEALLRWTGGLHPGERTGRRQENKDEGCQRNGGGGERPRRSLRSCRLCQPSLVGSCFSIEDELQPVNSSGTKLRADLRCGPSVRSKHLPNATSIPLPSSPPHVQYNPPLTIVRHRRSLLPVLQVRGRSRTAKGGDRVHIVWRPAHGTPGTDKTSGRARRRGERLLPHT